MTHFGWAVLSQMKQQAEVFDGDLVSKTGRDELLAAGLSRRDRKFRSGPYRGCQINELTNAGRVEAMRFADHDSATRN